MNHQKFRAPRSRRGGPTHKFYDLRNKCYLIGTYSDFLRTKKQLENLSIREGNSLSHRPNPIGYGSVSPSHMLVPRGLNRKCSSSTGRRIAVLFTSEKRNPTNHSALFHAGALNKRARRLKYARNAVCCLLTCRKQTLVARLEFYLCDESSRWKWKFASL